MWLQFLLENAHFAVNLFEALIIFAVFWLYFDAWTLRRKARDVPELIGFFLLTASFVIHATVVETSLSAHGLSGGISELATSVTRILAYLFIAVGLAIDPLTAHPGEKTGHKEEAKPTVPIQTAAIALAVPTSIGGIIAGLPILYPVLSVVIGFLYLRRATLGLEAHIKRVAFSFFVLSFSELLSLGYLFQETNNINIFKLVEPFGPLWLAQHLAALLAILILMTWVFKYLFKRLQTQLFMIFTTVVLSIFLLTTVAFTGLLLKNLQDETLRVLETDVKVLNFAVESKKSELASDASLIAQSPLVVGGIMEESRKDLIDSTQGLLLTKKLNTLIVVDADGKVLARGEDKERVGDSLSSDALIKGALLGKAGSSAATKDGPLAPIVTIRSATPIEAEGKVIGAVLAGTEIDNAFVDGVKSATGLATSVYGDNVLSATTLVSQDGKSRPLGIKEEDSKIKSKVLGSGENFTVAVDILNVGYFGAYFPLKDADNSPVGMLFVGREQIGVLKTAAKSIELTFIVTAVLLVLAVFPTYMISKFISGQVR